MALYKSGNLLTRGQNQMQSAQSTWGQRTKENQTTEYEPGSPSAGEMAGKAMGLMTLPGQVESAYGHLKDGAQWLASKFNAPNANAQAAQAGAGAQAAQGPAQEAVQMNTGAQVSAEELQNAIYKTPAQETEQLVNEAAAQAIDPVIPIQSVTPVASAAEGTQTATQAATQASQGGLSTMGASLGSAGGGIVGGLAGKELGQTIGGDTGATIGSVAGSLGSAYLGSMAAGSLAGAAGGAAAGATAGSVVPGMGTVIGASLGALKSFFL